MPVKRDAGKSRNRILNQLFSQYSGVKCQFRGLKVRTVEHHIKKMDLIFSMLMFGAVRIRFEIIRVNVDNNLTG